uniref:Uncharacterized protein n=1 Tax=Strigops habroptila TaxID=2489341 RepID=A0A672UFY2_STRHB
KGFAHPFLPHSGPGPPLSRFLIAPLGTGSCSLEPSLLQAEHPVYFNLVHPKNANARKIKWQEMGLEHHQSWDFLMTIKLMLALEAHCGSAAWLARVHQGSRWHKDVKASPSDTGVIFAISYLFPPPLFLEQPPLSNKL